MCEEERKPTVWPSFKKGFFAKIPNELEIKDRPELHLLPFNVLFSSMDELGKAVAYYPDLSTYRRDGATAYLRYFNTMSREWWLEIEYSEEKGLYTGHRYHGDRIICEADGNEWDGFFIHLTMMGPHRDEPADPVFEDILKIGA